MSTKTDQSGVGGGYGETEDDDLDDILHAALDDFDVGEANGSESATGFAEAKTRAKEKGLGYVSQGEGNKERVDEGHASDDKVSEDILAALADLKKVAQSGDGSGGVAEDSAGDVPNEHEEKLMDEILAALANLNKVAQRDDGHGGKSGSSAGVTDHENEDKILEGLVEQFESMGNLDEMVENLFSENVLKEPMQQMREQYDLFLSTNAASMNAEDLDRYQRQRANVQELCELYEKGNPESSRVLDLLAKMQELGAPPPEITNAMDAEEGDGAGAVSSTNVGEESLSDAELKSKILEQCNVQ